MLAIGYRCAELQVVPLRGVESCRLLRFNFATLNPQPSTLNPQPSTLNPRNEQLATSN